MTLSTSSPITFTLNGCLHTTQAATIIALVEQLTLTGKRIAIEINGNMCPKSAYASTFIQQNDTIEIVHAVGGG